MKTIALDGLYMSTKETTHSYLRWRLGAPDYYGCNLDALHDILTEPCEPTKLILYRKSLMLQSLGDYGTALLSVFHDSADENRNLIFVEAAE
ncbi:MAG: barstar family protein [Lachnospiraceae bacterium]|nr:barstar family protein [Lachnospiraceae bacterium]